MKDKSGSTIFVIIFFVVFFAVFLFLGYMMLSMSFSIGGKSVLEEVSTISPVIWIILIILIPVAYFIAVYNKLVSLKQKVNQSAGMIAVYLKQRFDLIPNLVETVKGYTKYEEGVIEKIIALRSDYNTNSQKDMGRNAELNNRYNQLIALVENYPELKANESFLNLQKQLSKIESQLQAARRIYNYDVTQYNTKVHTVPSNIIASMFGFKDANLFEIKADESENIQISI